MKVPGFTAEASCYGHGSVYVRGGHHRIGQKIYPASYIDQDCYDNCFQNCSDLCSGSGKGHTDCLNRCRQHNAGCRSSCTRVGTAPQPASKSVSPTDLEPPTAHVWIDDSQCTRVVKSCGGSFASISDCQASGCPICASTGVGIVCCHGVCVERKTCTHFDGQCTGTHLWLWETPPMRCIQGQCCGGWNQFPWVVQCDDGSTSMGCGFCLW
jgi:hypothetical protein